MVAKAGAPQKPVALGSACAAPLVRRLGRCRNEGPAFALIAGIRFQRSTCNDPAKRTARLQARELNGTAEQVADKVREFGEEALTRADEWLKPVGLSIKERPMTVLAVVGGLAFAAGAWAWLLRFPEH